MEYLFIYFNSKHTYFGASLKRNEPGFDLILQDLIRFNEISIQGTPQMTVGKEARVYRESTHIVILSVPCPYTKYDLPYLDTCLFCSFVRCVTKTYRS